MNRIERVESLHRNHPVSFTWLDASALNAGLGFARLERFLRGLIDANAIVEIGPGIYRWSDRFLHNRRAVV